MSGVKKSFISGYKYTYSLQFGNYVAKKPLKYWFNNYYLVSSFLIDKNEKKNSQVDKTSDIYPYTEYKKKAFRHLLYCWILYCWMYSTTPFFSFQFIRRSFWQCFLPSLHEWTESRFFSRAAHFFSVLKNRAQMFTVYSRGLLELNCFTGRLNFPKDRQRRMRNFYSKKLFFLETFIGRRIF